MTEISQVTESIFNGSSIIVPLADVQHIEKQQGGGLVVVTKHTRWDPERDFWVNNIWIDASDSASFISAWCRYRSELEADTLADLSPASDMRSSIMKMHDETMAALTSEGSPSKTPSTDFVGSLSTSCLKPPASPGDAA